MNTNHTEYAGHHFQCFQTGGGWWGEVYHNGKFAATTTASGHSMKETADDAASACRMVIDHLNRTMEVRVVNPNTATVFSDLLYRDEHGSEPWEVLLKAMKAARQLTDDEVSLLDETTVKAAFAHGLVDRERAEKRIVDIQDDCKERSWYAD